MSKRKLQRIKSTDIEIEKNSSKLVLEDATSGKKNDELFTIDRKGSKSIRNRMTVVDEKQGQISQTELKLLKKVMRASKPDSTIDLKKDTSINQLIDLWQTDNLIPTSNSDSTQPSKKKKTILHSGISYNPSFSSHENIMAEALALEMTRIDTENQNKMSFFLTAPLFNSNQNGDDVNPESDDEDISLSLSNIGTAADGSGALRKPTQRERITRAKRNKRKAHNLMQLGITQRKTKESLMKSINALPKYISDIDSEEKKCALKKRIKDLKKSTVVDPTRLKNSEVSTVPLSDELRGSIRQMAPKNASMQTTLDAMVESGKAWKPLKKRRKYDKPHGSRRVVWVAKHKYK